MNLLNLLQNIDKMLCKPLTFYPFSQIKKTPEHS